MRPNFVFVLLVGLLGALGFLVVKHARSAVAVVMPAATPKSGVAGEHARDAGEPRAASDGDAKTSPAKAEAAPAKALDRALKVTALGWDLLASAIAENDGLTPDARSGFTTGGIDVELVASPTVDRLESRLVSGGSQVGGADVALLPLPVFVASYERLRALEPEVFFVIGWSRGREGLLGRRGGLSALPTGGDILMSSAGTDAATYFGLFALDLAGIPPSRVRLTPRLPESPNLVSLAAVDRSRKQETLGQHLLATTADASRLIPLVAVATHGFIEAHPAALRAWAKGTLRGVERLRKDVPSAAREIAAIDGAPDAVSLLVGLGQLAPASVRDNAELMGLSGRDAVTLARLFDSAWRLWRGVGVLSTPEPDALPVSSGVVTALAHDESENDATPAPAPRPVPKEGSAPVVFLAHAEPGGKLDDAKVIAATGWIAGIFASTVVRVSAAGKGSAARIALGVTDAYGVAPGRVVPGQASLGGASAVVEVMASP